MEQTMLFNSPVMHLQNFKRLCMGIGGIQCSPMFAGEFCASSLTHQWTVYTHL